MVTFRSNRECRDIAVNPDTVLWVCHYENDACTLHFGKECFVRVKGNIDDVVRRLEGCAEDASGVTSTRRSEPSGAELN